MLLYMANLLSLIYWFAGGFCDHIRDGLLEDFHSVCLLFVGVMSEFLFEVMYVCPI